MSTPQELLATTKRVKSSLDLLGETKHISTKHNVDNTKNPQEMVDHLCKVACELNDLREVVYIHRTPYIAGYMELCRINQKIEPLQFELEEGISADWPANISTNTSYHELVADIVEQQFLNLFFRFQVAHFWIGNKGFQPIRFREAIEKVVHLFSCWYSFLPRDFPRDHPPRLGFMLVENEKPSEKIVNDWWSAADIGYDYTKKLRALLELEFTHAVSICEFLPSLPETAADVPPLMPPSERQPGRPPETHDIADFINDEFQKTPPTPWSKLPRLCRGQFPQARIPIEARKAVEYLRGCYRRKYKKSNGRK